MGGLSDSRTAWLSDWLGALEDCEAVLVQLVIEGLRRLCYGVAAADELKPFMGPFYAWCAMKPAGSYVTVPNLLRILARFLRTRMVAGVLRASVKHDNPVFGPAPGHFFFRADARVEGGEGVEGGWRCQGGRLPQDAPCLSFRMQGCSQQSSPCAQSR